MKKVLITIAIVFAVLLISAAAVPYLFKDQIVAKVKSVINQKVNAKVDFKEFDLTLIRSFPKMGIRLNDLSVVGVDSFAQDTLANIKQLQLDLNLMSVIKGETYEINAVSLQEPTILAKVLKSGKANWDIMKPDSTAKPTDTASTAFKAALEKYSIEKGKITYDDASLNFFLQAEDLNHTGKGNFTQDIFTLTTLSDIEKLTVKYGGIPYLNGVVLDASLPLEMDMKQMKFKYEILKTFTAGERICINQERFQWMHILDNEAPEAFKQAIRDNKCKVELTPADQHRRNAAERAIQTFKGHFISVLAGVSTDFPIHQWDELLPQAILTLNLLRQSNVAPNVSAYAYHHGNFDYNRMPLAPMGCAVQFHIKPNRRKTFGEHSSDGWYLRTSPEHYRAHWVFVKATKAKRITDTVFFKHKYITQPTVTKADAIVNAYRKLADAINGIQHSQDDAHIEALHRIQEVLKPGNEMPIDKYAELRPRVQQTAQQEPTFESRPRVQFDEAVATPERLIVAWPQKQVVQSLPRKQVVQSPKPKPIFKPPKYVVESETIADRVKAKRAAPQTRAAPQAQATPPVQDDNLSIAERVAARRRSQQPPDVEVVHAVLDQETGQLLEYRQLLKHPRFKEVWNRSSADEFGRLAQGVGGRIKGTDTIRFIHKHEVPQDRFKDCTYIKFVCTIRTEKKDPYRTRATMGGNLINYPDDVGTPTANLLLIKIFLNSVILTPGARFANADISNFYLMTLLKRPEYAKIRLSDIPEEIIEEYNLQEKATPDGWVYIMVIRGMYGLPQSVS